ncbi:MAG: DUF6272 family protein [Bacteroidia bacterium]|nr:DUF6272 family protein [Bacteroidia bacterium]MCX7651698.1 DUF6272 family protein [Bacteroidia bacterium]MDW8417430.1 DUF6272 family protein [Bacteroidia bacterium]
MIAVDSELLHEPALSYAYPLYRNMLDNNIVFMYNGPITTDFMVDVLNLVEYRLEDTKEERRVSKKLFNIMVESFTLGEDQNRGNATLLVRQLPYLYSVSIGRRVSSSSVYMIKSFIDWVNSLQDEQLRDAYHDLLQNKNTGMPPQVGGIPTISILDLARKSHDFLQYYFEYLDDTDSFFSLEARIKKSKS